MKLSVKAGSEAKGRVSLHGQKATMVAFGQKCRWTAARKLGSSVPMGGSLKGIILSVVDKWWGNWSGWAGLGKARFLWVHEIGSQSGRLLPGAWILQGWVYSHCQHSQCSREAGVALVGTRGWTQSSSYYSSLASPDSYAPFIACRKILAKFSRGEEKASWNAMVLELGKASSD